MEHRVRALLGVEREIEEALGGQLERATAHAELRAGLSEMQNGCRVRGQDLSVYLREHGFDSAVSSSPVAPLLAQARSAELLSEVLSVDAAAFGFAASEYAGLTELAFRLYDPALRELAPQHLTAHTQAVRLLNHLLAGVVVEELDARGLSCLCICPMCGLGACGCRVVGRACVSEAWSEAQSSIDERPGLVLTPPRPGSPLADQGVEGGDRLVAIDGQPVTATGMEAVREIQTAIRTHEIGDEMLVTIAQASGQPRELRVRHVSDYQPG
ncbi:MAG: PDZ domain-containing protein [Gaiellaceae bacterium]